jgi:hypothetical protein
MKRDDLGNYVLSLDETYGWKRPSYQYDQLRARIDRRLRLIANRRGRPVNLYSHNKRDLLEHYAPEMIFHGRRLGGQRLPPIRPRGES